MADPTQFLTSVRASLSQDGIIAELQMVRANGKVAYIQFPAAAAANVMLNIELALGTLFEKQRAMLKGEDPRTFFQIAAKQVSKVQGGIAQGVPVVSFVLSTGVRLDFALDQQAIPDLIDWLQGLEAAAQKSSPARN